MLKNLLLLIFLILFSKSFGQNSNSIDDKLKLQKVELKLDEISDDQKDLEIQQKEAKENYQREFDNLKEDLNYHSNSIDTWLSVLGILFSFFGIIIPLAGFFVGRKLFNDIEKQKKLTESELQNFIESQKSEFEHFKKEQLYKVQQLVVDSQEKYEEIVQIRDKSLISHELPIESENPNVTDEKPSSDHALQTLTRMFQLISENKYDEVIKVGEEFLGSDISQNEKYHTLYMISNAYYSLQDYTNAEISIKRAIEINDKDYKSWTNLGLLFSKRESNIEAIMAFKRAQELNSIDPKPISNEALVYLQMGNPKEALKIIERALIISPDNPDFNIVKANCLFELNLKIEAIEFLTNLSEKFPENEKFLQQTSAYYYKLGMFEKAIEKLEKATNVNSENANLFRLLGAANTSYSKFDQAYVNFKKAYELDKSIHFQLDYAESLIFKFKYDEFRAIWEQIEKFEDELKKSHLGYFYLKSLFKLITDESKNFKEILDEFGSEIHSNNIEFSWTVNDTEAFLASPFSSKMDDTRKIHVSLFVKGAKDLVNGLK